MGGSQSVFTEQELDDYQVESKLKWKFTLQK